MGLGWPVETSMRSVAPWGPNEMSLSLSPEMALRAVSSNLGVILLASGHGIIIQTPLHNSKCGSGQCICNVVIHALDVLKVGGKFRDIDKMSLLLTRLWI